MPQSLWQLDRFEAEGMELMHLRREQYNRKRTAKIQLIKERVGALLFIALICMVVLICTACK